MDDQVSYLCNLGVPPVAITDEEDSELVQQILTGTYVIVFGSLMFIVHCFARKSSRICLLALAIDDALCHSVVIFLVRPNLSTKQVTNCK